MLGGDGAVLVLHEDLAELQDLLAQRGDLLRQDVVLLAVEISFGLQILQPLLLPLATFEGGDAVALEKVLSLLLVGHLPTVLGHVFVV